ncbi:MAG: hypothetical protein QOF77_158 [Solirubrobacteraceae bacterium]|jgi:hypothetical protein|nr:hypothetical protein [Solirubrobacteraceae bacterium]
MPKFAPARLAASAAATVLLCCAPVAAPALAASHKSKHLTMAVAKATALKSATPLILDPADQVRVTGCSKSGSSYTCGLQLHAASSASVCNWTVVVKKVRGIIDVVKYSHIDCAG